MEDLYSNQEARLRFEAYRYIPYYLQHCRLWQQEHCTEEIAFCAAACKLLLLLLERAWPSQKLWPSEARCASTS